MAIVVEHDKRKHEILQKSLDVFIDEGYEDATFQKIADRCGITRTTLYIYFKNKHEIFYNLIKFWTLIDFCTPNIKAEVIFDMLLSPFITDIVKEGMNSNGRFVLLAKEFPLKVYENNKGPKVDYLLMDDGTSDLYIVELKTDNNSFDVEQYNKYLKAIKKV